MLKSSWLIRSSNNLDSITTHSVTFKKYSGYGGCYFVASGSVQFMVTLLHYGRFNILYLRVISLEPLPTDSFKMSVIYLPIVPKRGLEPTGKPFMYHSLIFNVILFIVFICRTLGNIFAFFSIMKIDLLYFDRRLSFCYYYSSMSFLCLIISLDILLKGFKIDGFRAENGHMDFNNGIGRELLGTYLILTLISHSGSRNYVLNLTRRKNKEKEYGGIMGWHCNHFVVTALKRLFHS